MIEELQLDQALSILHQGGLVAFPTETVYGLGADAGNPKALERIFAAKGRPIDHPLIIHLADVSQLSDWASVIPAEALRLAAAFWPGPLTMILKKAPHVSDLVTGCQETVGLRIPKHPVAQALLKAFGRGLAGPSANRFGRISPTSAKAVYEGLGDRVDCILEGGQCEVGLESTIIDLSSKQPVILRPGMISAEQIEAILQQSIELKGKNTPRVSGALASHYAPETKTCLIDSSQLKDYLKTLHEADFPQAVLSYQPALIQQEGIVWVEMPKDPIEYARILYKTLHLLDKQHFHQIVIESMPVGSAWDAIRDRVQKASA